MSTRSVERPPILIRGRKHADRGYCYGVQDGLDGYCVHTASCISAGESWSGPNSSCVRSGEDGEALKRERDEDAERRRFTPPEYRDDTRLPGPIITMHGQQAEDVVALRGRPRGLDGPWSTWETFVDIGDPSVPAFIRHMRRGGRSYPPLEMTADQARAIVERFTDRVPHYEFQIVRARLVVEEEVLG